MALLAAGLDAAGQVRGLGVSTIQFKLVTPDLFILENTFHSPGGPARHLHYDQDEWFYAVEGEFALEIGEERLVLRAGDSALAPRQVPHVWAFTGQGRGRMLIAFSPPGRMREFFEIVTQANAMPPLDPALWEAHGMKLVGPPLSLG